MWLISQLGNPLKLAWRHQIRCDCGMDRQKFGISIQKKNRTMVDKLPQLGCSHQIVALNQVSHQLLRGMVVRNAGCCWVVYPKKYLSTKRHEHATNILWMEEILHHQKYGWNPTNNEISHLSTGEGFCNHPLYHSAINASLRTVTNMIFPVLSRVPQFLSCWVYSNLMFIG